MFEELQTTFLGILSSISENNYTQALIVAVFSLILAMVFDRIIISFLKKLVLKTNSNSDDLLIHSLHSPIYNSILLLGFSFSVLLLSLPELATSIIFSLFKTIALTVWVAFFLKLNSVVLTSISRNDKRVKMIHNQTLPLFLNLMNIVIVIMAVYLLFSAWHIDMTAWLASAGIMGIAIGFAAKDTLANLFSGVFIMADAPYKIGDFVVLDTLERGEVTHIGIRSTRILTRADVEVTIPNSVMGNTKITNESGGPHEKSRCKVPIGVAYGSDIEKVREILMDIALAETEVCADPVPRVRFRLFGASSLDFDLLVWINKPMIRGRVIDSLNCAIYQKFIEHNIEIPYAKQDLYIKEFPSRD